MKVEYSPEKENISPMTTSTWVSTPPPEDLSDELTGHEMAGRMFFTSARENSASQEQQSQQQEKNVDDRQITRKSGEAVSLAVGHDHTYTSINDKAVVDIENGQENDELDATMPVKNDELSKVLQF